MDVIAYIDIKRQFLVFFASNQNITQSDIKISSLHDEEGLSLNATSLSTDSVNLHNRKNASSLASREQEVVGEFTYHTNYLYVTENYVMVLL